MSGLDEKPLGYLLYRVAAALRAEVTDAVLTPLGLAFPQYLCMRVLSVSPGLSSAELARNINVSPQAMNVVLRGLEDLGLVNRPATVSSGRALPAELTSDGKTLLRRADTGVRAAEGRVLANLAETQRRELKRLLATVDADPPH
ncbi:MAG: transcriptional regulator [Mycobacterium sp.]|nr:transcriptional regulator [Mycobacterium sp.]